MRIRVPCIVSLPGTIAAGSRSDAVVQSSDFDPTFTLRGGDWQEITVEIPATGSLGIVRVYLPKQDQPVEIDWIEIHSKTGDKSTRTDF